VQGNLETTEIIITEESIASDNGNTVTLDVSGIGEGLGALASGIGDEIGDVVDYVNPLDDFMDNIKTVIIVDCVIAGVVVIIIIVVVICCIVNKREITKLCG
jgi:hypothetical protein